MVFGGSFSFVLADGVSGRPDRDLQMYPTVVAALVPVFNLNGSQGPGCTVRDVLDVWLLDCGWVLLSLRLFVDFLLLTCRMADAGGKSAS